MELISIMDIHYTCHSPGWTHAFTCCQLLWTCGYSSHAASCQCRSQCHKQGEYIVYIL